MKTPLIVLVLLALVVAGVLGFRSMSQKETALADSDFTNAITYICDEGKVLGAAFADDIIRISLPDKRVFTLERASSDDESGTKFANEGDQIVFWTKDDSAFLEEGSVTTYAECRNSAAQFPVS